MSIRDKFPIDKWDFKRESVLENLPEEDWNNLMSHITEHAYKKGDILFRQGGFPVGIYLIAEGKVKKYTTDRDGKEQIIYVANKGELIGYHAILAEDRYPDSAATLEESRIGFIAREDFLTIISESEVLNRRLLKCLSHEFSVLVNNLTMLAQKSVRERLAHQLIILREKYKVDFSPGMAVEIDMSRDDLANLVGTARENVVRVLTNFKYEGALETRGRKIIILDVNQLIKIAGYG